MVHDPVTAEAFQFSSEEHALPHRAATTSESATVQRKLETAFAPRRTRRSNRFKTSSIASTTRACSSATILAAAANFANAGVANRDANAGPTSCKSSRSASAGSMRDKSSIGFIPRYDGPARAPCCWRWPRPGSYFADRDDRSRPSSIENSLSGLSELARPGFWPFWLAQSQPSKSSTSSATRSPVDIWAVRPRDGRAVAGRHADVILRRL